MWGGERGRAATHTYTAGCTYLESRDVRRPEHPRNRETHTRVEAAAHIVPNGG